MGKGEHHEEAHASLVSLAGYLALGRYLDDDALLRLIMEIGVALVSAEEGSLLLLDRSSAELEFMMTIGPAESANTLKGQRFSMHQGITGLAASTGEPQSGSPTYHGVRQADRGEGEPRQPTAVLAVPMLVEEEVLGVITAVSFVEGRTFAPQEIDLYCKFSTLCGHVVRQRRREDAVRGILLGEEPQTALPADTAAFLASHPLSASDRAVERIAQSLGTLSRGREDILPLCADMVGTMAKIAGELAWKA